VGFFLGFSVIGELYKIPPGDAEPKKRGLSSGGRMDAGPFEGAERRVQFQAQYVSGAPAGLPPFWSA
jgi:hypothetical protein